MPLTLKEGLPHSGEGDSVNTGPHAQFPPTHTHELCNCRPRLSQRFGTRRSHRSAVSAAPVFIPANLQNLLTLVSRQHLEKQTALNKSTCSPDWAFSLLLCSSHSLLFYTPSCRNKESVQSVHTTLGSWFLHSCGGSDVSVSSLPDAESSPSVHIQPLLTCQEI